MSVLICLMMSVFISITLEGVISFSRIKNLPVGKTCTCKRHYYSQSSWQDFFSCKGGNLENLKDTTAFSLFLVC